MASECLRRADVLPCQVDELIVGNILALEGNPARIISLAMGMGNHVAGVTIDRQCAGGLDALLLADALIKSGQAEVVIAGGVESYTRRPTCYPAQLDGNSDIPCWQPPFTPWPDSDPDMFDAASRLADKFCISRLEQDDWAIESHHKALANRQSLSIELVSSNVFNLDHDGHSGRISPRLCARARPIIGTITAANTAIEADCAAFCLLASEAVVKQTSRNAVRFATGFTVGADHELPGYATVPAINKSLDALGLASTDLTCSEIMEAFAAQAIVGVRCADLDSQTVNISGGALARGHPGAASGAVLAVRLFHELQNRMGYGLAAIAAAGGLATCVILES